MLSLVRLKYIEECCETERWLYRYILAKNDNEILMEQLDQFKQYLKKAEEHLLPEQFNEEHWQELIAKHRQRLLDGLIDEEEIYLEIDDALQGLPRRALETAKVLYFDGEPVYMAQETLGIWRNTMTKHRKKIINHVAKKRGNNGRQSEDGCTEHILPGGEGKDGPDGAGEQ